MPNQFLNQFPNQCLNPYLLLVLSVAVIIASIIDDRLISEVFVLVLLSIIMILLAIRMARMTHRTYSANFFKALLSLIAVSILCDGLAYLHKWPIVIESFLFFVASLIKFLIFGYGWLSLVKTLANKQKVTDNTIATAIIAYLFIGILYSFVYIAIWRLDPKAFHISVAGDYDFKPWNLAMYFSFMTLTTVGYGDIIPVNKLLMALSMFEAMTGAIYLTIVVARLVSLYSVSD